MIVSLINDWLRSVGFEIRRAESKRRFGYDSLCDIEKIVGSRNLTIFDVGANEGQTSVLFSNRFPNSIIHAFEPFSGAFQKLRDNTSAYRNIIPHHMALGKEDGVGTIFLNKDSRTNSLFPNSSSLPEWADSREGVKPAGTESIELKRLDSFCNENDISKINVLKLDCQGYEMEILRGSGYYLSPRHIDLIYTEVLFVPLYEGQACFIEVFKMLDDPGFKLVGIYGTNRSEVGFLKWCDALFAS